MLHIFSSKNLIHRQDVLPSWCLFPTPCICQAPWCWYPSHLWPCHLCIGHPTFFFFSHHPLSASNLMNLHSATTNSPCLLNPPSYPIAIPSWPNFKMQAGIAPSYHPYCRCLSRHLQIVGPTTTWSSHATNYYDQILWLPFTKMQSNTHILNPKWMQP